jgi:hypothetical protein
MFVFSTTIRITISAHWIELVLCVLQPDRFAEIRAAVILDGAQIAFKRYARISPSGNER